MFFSPDLLERRDSGYGLLWLAATLGAKSSFKKLPKRSVLTADISQLCGLIAEPAEPLALRLSSNLMIGVARVYKVKQEIFHADVTACFNSLKKATQDLSALSNYAAQLQMGQPALRVEALTLVADPGAVFGIDFDNITMAWNDRIQGGNMDLGDVEGDRDSDDDFDPVSKKPKSKPKGKQKDAPPSSVVAEHARARHTLEEHHNVLLSAAFDGSLTGSVQAGPGYAASSSQFGGFDDNLFAFPDAGGVDIDIGDELARELGEGWGISTAQPTQRSPVQPGLASPHDAPLLDVDMNIGPGEDFTFGFEQDVNVPPRADGNPEDLASIGSLLPNGSVILPMAPFSPHGSQGDAGMAEEQTGKDKPTQRKPKRVRLLLDARIELTDEELKMARANYVEEQEILKRDVARKKAEREGSKLIEEMLYGAPRGVEAPVLVDFWLENFRLHVGARSGELRLEVQGEPPTKRRRVQDPVSEQPGFDIHDVSSPARLDDFRMDVDNGDFGAQHGGYGDDYNSRMRSSEEPGQARRGSRPSSAMGSHLNFDLGPAQDIISGSQRSGFFPWDHAGPSSSAGGGLFETGSDIMSRRRRGSKRGSSLGSKTGSFIPLGGGGTVPPSPIPDFGLRNSQIGADDFEFNVPDEPTQEESQSILTLEKNSFNFLEYAKMQSRAFPTATGELAFDEVVPKATSTRRVAAAAFYHCLVLSTKDLLSVRQDVPYDVLHIKVK